MAYTYCRKCDAGQDNPTFEECIRGRIICHCCTEEIPINSDERDDALIQLEERLASVEEMLVALGK